MTSGSQDSLPREIVCPWRETGRDGETCRLELNSVIHQGVFGTIFRCTSVTSKTEYVVKRVDLRELREDEITYRQQEAKLWSRLRHPHILTCLVGWPNERCLWILNESAEDTLEHVVQGKDTHPPEDLFVNWLHQLACALAYLHEEQSSPILHRHLKPSSIMVAPHYILKLADFGFSKQLDGRENVATSIIGTYKFMSPEMINKKPYDAKTDMWSLGVTAVFVALLQDAIKASSFDTVVRRTRDGQARSIQGVYSSVTVNLVHSLLQVDPAHRPKASMLRVNLRLCFKHCQTPPDASSYPEKRLVHQILSADRLSRRHSEDNQSSRRPASSTRRPATPSRPVSKSRRRTTGLAENALSPMSGQERRSLHMQIPQSQESGTGTGSVRSSANVGARAMSSASVLTFEALSLSLLTLAITQKDSQSEVPKIKPALKPIQGIKMEHKKTGSAMADCDIGESSHNKPDKLVTSVPDLKQMNEPKLRHSTEKRGGFLNKSGPVLGRQRSEENWNRTIRPLTEPPHQDQRGPRRLSEGDQPASRESASVLADQQSKSTRQNVHRYQHSGTSHGRRHSRQDLVLQDEENEDEEEDEDEDTNNENDKVDTAWDQEPPQLHSDVPQAEASHHPPLHRSVSETSSKAEDKGGARENSSSSSTSFLMDVPIEQWPASMRNYWILAKRLMDMLGADMYFTVVNFAQLVPREDLEMFLEVEGVKVASQCVDDVLRLVRLDSQLDSHTACDLTQSLLGRFQPGASSA